MNHRLRRRWLSLKKDYEAVTGTPFRHFYCPILFRDEQAPLCEAHIINQAFGGSSREWTIQRSDVDSFFGSRFESDFTSLALRDALGTQNVLGDRKLRQKLRPTIVAGAEEIGFFIPDEDVPRHFTAVMSSDETLPPIIGLRITEEEVVAKLANDWSIEISFDIRVQSLVSLIKAAHLTKFHLFGYCYVLSAAGHFVGHTLLGEFFEINKHSSREGAVEAAKEHFAKVRNMVRPVVDNSYGFQGTVSDRSVCVCWGSSALPWATVVFIRTGELLHAVMMPVSDRVEALATYFDFLENDNETVAMRVATFTSPDAPAPWRFNTAPVRMNWTKRNIQLR